MGQIWGVLNLETSLNILPKLTIAEDEKKKHQQKKQMTNKKTKSIYSVEV